MSIATCLLNENDEENLMTRFLQINKPAFKSLFLIAAVDEVTK